MAKRKQTWERAARKRKALRIRNASARAEAGEETKPAPKAKPEAGAAKKTSKAASATDEAQD